MIKTLGLTHIALPVKDVKRSSAFYKKVFGAKEMYHDREFIQVQTPGSKDIIVFIKKNRSRGKIIPGFHFGFRLPKPSGIRNIIQVIKKAGGKIKETGELFPVSHTFSFMILMDMKLRSGLRISRRHLNHLINNKNLIYGNSTFQFEKMDR
jgi:catechol 2,3-dioxygenase-like lactoylglutathione lyase family enzyme